MNICRKLLPLKCLWMGKYSTIPTGTRYTILHANRAPFTRYSFRACNAMTGFCFGFCTVVMSAVSAVVMEHFYMLCGLVAADIFSVSVSQAQCAMVTWFFLSSGVLWFPSLSWVFLYMWLCRKLFFIITVVQSARTRLYSEL